MKNQLLIIAISSLSLMISCNKQEDIIPQKPVESTIDVIAPAGFTWESSRNVNFTINVSNGQSPNMIHVISLYDGDPATGGTLISKGSATAKEGFKCKVYLPNHISELFVIGTFPNGSTVNKKLPITRSDLSLTLNQ
jgi:hypothetical protein